MTRQPGSSVGWRPTAPPFNLYGDAAGDTALERRASLALGHGAVAQAKQAVYLALGEFFRQAIDPSVESRISTVTRGEIEAIRGTMIRMREALWNCIRPL